MKVLIIAASASLLLTSCSAQGFIKASRQVHNSCAKAKAGKNTETYHSVRAKLHESGKLSFTEPGFDTLFLLEKYEIETGKYIGRIWNRGGSVSYEYSRGKFSYRENLFTGHTVYLVEKWDTLSIRKEETENATIMPERRINAARVINHKGKLKIDCMSFREFFKLERDRFINKETGL
ncbi:MAG TPA: hypothetical protein VGB46_00090 [Flavisolibacter sp.]|jgi:hypothetical protein